MLKILFIAACLSPLWALALPCGPWSAGGAPKVSWGAAAAGAAEEFSAVENPSSGLLKGGGGKVGQGIQPGTPIGSKAPPARDLRPNLVPNRVDNPDARHTNITNRADRNKLNSPNH